MWDWCFITIALSSILLIIYRTLLYILNRPGGTVNFWVFCTALLNKINAISVDVKLLYVVLIWISTYRTLLIIVISEYILCFSLIVYFKLNIIPDPLSLLLILFAGIAIDSLCWKLKTKLVKSKSKIFYDAKKSFKNRNIWKEKQQNLASLDNNVLNCWHYLWRHYFRKTN